MIRRILDRLFPNREVLSRCVHCKAENAHHPTRPFICHLCGLQTFPVGTWRLVQ